MDDTKAEKGFTLGIQNPLAGLGIVLWLVILCIVFALLTPDFLTGSNLLNITKQTSVVGIVAVGLTFVIITGGIDLSVGSLISFCGAVLGVTWEATGNIFVAGLACLATGLLAGTISGLLVGRAGIPPFIATFGMMGVGAGMAFVLAPTTIGGFPRGFDFLGSGHALGVPVPAILMVSVALVAQYFLTRTRFGVRVLSIGGSEPAARLTGVDVPHYKTMVYVISGLLSGLGALVLCARLRSAYPGVGQGYELTVIAATVIGGVDLMGGKGSAIGAVVGALLIGVIQNGLNLLGVAPFMQQIATGLLIVIAVLANQIQGNRIWRRWRAMSRPSKLRS